MTEETFAKGKQSFMSVEQNKALIKAFLARAFRGHKVQDDEDIFALGFVSSLFAMELVIFVEKTFGITIENEDLDLENFRTVSALAAFIERKSGNIDLSARL